MKTSFFALLVAFMLVASMLCGCASGEASDFTLAKTIVPTEDLGLSVGDSLTEAFKEMTNSNPVSSTIFFADPTSVEYNGRLYVYGTNDSQEFDQKMGMGDNSYGSINTLVCYSTDDMVNWRYETTVPVTEVCTWAGCSWAPSIVSRKEGTKTHFYLYFCNSAGGVGVLTSTSPTGPWTDPVGGPLVSNDKLGDDPVFWCFDPGVVIDDNGVGWLAFGGGEPVHADESGMYTGNCRIVRLGKDMASLDSEIVKVPSIFHFEANELNYINGTYVLTYCSNYADRSMWKISWGKEPQTCSMCYMTSTDPLNPDSWQWGGEYLVNPNNFGFDFSNNHTHLQKFGDKYYILYQNVSLLMNMGKTGGYRSINVDEIEVDEANVVIKPGTMTRTGVSQIKNPSALDVTEAETSAVSAGIKYYTDDDRTFVTSIDDGDWIALRGVDFADGVNSFAATVRGKGTIEVRLDSPDGKAVGQIQFSTNGEFSAISCELTKNVSGIHDLYFVLGGGSFVFDNWQFANIQEEAAE